jgi:hypothetical protein
MIVTLASAGPFAQSDAVTGGKFDSVVGPAVGFLVTAVQPWSGRATWAGRVTSAAAGLELVVAVAVTAGVACVSGKQAERTTAISRNKTGRNFRICFSEVKYVG